MNKKEDLKRQSAGLKVRTRIKSGSVNPYSSCERCKLNCPERSDYWECIAACENLACA